MIWRLNTVAGSQTLMQVKGKWMGCHLIWINHSSCTPIIVRCLNVRAPWTTFDFSSGAFHHEVASINLRGLVRRAAGLDFGNCPADQWRAWLSQRDDNNRWSTAPATARKIRWRDQGDGEGFHSVLAAARGATEGRAQRSPY